jgi:hypothetical protein
MRNGHEEGSLQTANASGHRRGERGGATNQRRRDPTWEVASALAWRERRSLEAKRMRRRATAAWVVRRRVARRAANLGEVGARSETGGGCAGRPAEESR